MAETTSDPFATLDALRDIYIETSRDSILRQHIDRLLRRDAEGNPLPQPVTFTATGDTHGIALVEGAGGGKTSLVDHVLKNHPALQSDDSACMPWIGVNVPSPATLKSLGLEILSKSGYPGVSPKKKGMGNLAPRPLPLEAAWHGRSVDRRGT